MTRLPETNNFYSFFEDISTIEIFNLLEKNGWTSRKSGANEFEFSDALSELELYPTEDGALLNGRLAKAPDKYSEITKIFRDAGAKFSAELYDESNTLLTSDNNLKGTST